MRRIALVAQVWLTAFMVLVAGMPHCHCVCPNGHVKPFCVSLLVRASCCCNGSCCTASPTENTDRTSPGGSPCCSRPRHPSTAPHSHHQLCRRGCEKTLTAAELAITPAPPDHGHGFTSCVPLTLLASDRPAAGLPSESRRLTGHCHWSSPPTDLVVVLQHFLI